MPANESFLHYVFGIRHAPEHAVRYCKQERPTLIEGMQSLALGLRRGVASHAFSDRSLRPGGTFRDIALGGCDSHLLGFKFQNNVSRFCVKSPRQVLLC